MIIKKKKKMPNIITTSNCENGDQDFQDKNNAPPDRHFSFLDEMEAPMWVDLSLECKSAYEDKDDEWFNLSHPFHQLSSRELIAALSGLNEGCSKLDFGITGTKSPKLPSSVSKSRGKDYKSRDWGKDKHKTHPVKNLSSKGSLVNFGSLNVIKDGSYRRKVKEKPLVRSISHKGSSLTESGGANSLNSLSSSADLKNQANSIGSSIVDSHSASTITVEDTEQHQQKSVEVSSQVHGLSRGLLSAALRVTLRKSCVTRQASRYEVNHGRQSEGRNSCSSKSSVGSSFNPGSEGKDLTARSSKDKTPESINATRASQALNDKVWHQDKCRNILVPHKINANTATKTKVKDAARYSKVARTGKENEAGKKSIVQKSSGRHNHPTTASKAKEKTIAGHYSGTLGGPKAIAERGMGLSQKSSSLEKGTKDTIQTQVNTKRRGPQNSRMEKLVAHKGRPSGAISEVKRANAAGKVYLR